MEIGLAARVFAYAPATTLIELFKNHIVSPVDVLEALISDEDHYLATRVVTSYMKHDRDISATPALVCRLDGGEAESN